MNTTNRRGRQPTPHLLLPPMLALTALLVGCGGSKQTNAPLPTFKLAYTFSNPTSYSQVTVLPEGTAYGITYRATSATTAVYELTRYTDFGKGPATVIASPVAYPDASYSVAVSQVNGNIYVAVPTTFPIDKIGVFSPLGQQLFAFTNPAPVPGHRGSDRIVIDSKGFVYILGQNTSGANFVYKCDPSGNLLKAIDVSAVSFGVDAPMAIDAADHLYVVGAKVSELSTDGTLIKQFTADGGTITAVGVDGKGNIYVADNGANGEYVLSRFSPDGLLTAQGSGPITFSVDTYGTVYERNAAYQVTP